MEGSNAMYMFTPTFIVIETHIPNPPKSTHLDRAGSCENQKWRHLGEAPQRRRPNAVGSDRRCDSTPERQRYRWLTQLQPHQIPTTNLPSRSTFPGDCKHCACVSCIHNQLRSLVHHRRCIRADLSQLQRASSKGCARCGRSTRSVGCAGGAYRFPCQVSAVYEYGS